MERYTNIFQGIGKFATFCVDSDITSIECSPHRIPVDVQSHLSLQVSEDPQQGYTNASLPPNYLVDITIKIAGGRYFSGQLGQAIGP